MSKNQQQPIENKAVSEIPLGKLVSKTKGIFTVMSIDSAEYQKESTARKNKNREKELKALDPETKAQIEAANAQGKGVMWKKPDGSSYLFVGQKPTEKSVSNDDTKKKEDEKGAWAWCKRNWGWLLAGAVAIGVGAYFLIRNKNKKKDKNKTIASVKKGNTGNGSTLSQGVNTQITAGTTSSGATTGGNSSTSNTTATTVGNSSTSNTTASSGSTTNNDRLTIADALQTGGSHGVTSSSTGSATAALKNAGATPFDASGLSSTQDNSWGLSKLIAPKVTP